MTDRSPYQLFDDLDDESYQALKADIREHGVLVPVEYDDDGNILDGHHRVRAHTELVYEGVELEPCPRIVREGLNEAEKRAHVRALNIFRRHLTPAQKRQYIQDQLREMPTTSNRQIAADLGVDHKTVGSERRRLEASGEIPQIEVRSVERGGQTYTQQTSNIGQRPPSPRVPVPDFEDDIPLDVERDRTRQRLLASYTRGMEAVTRLIALEPVFLARGLDEERRRAHRDTAAGIRRWLERVEKELDRVPVTPSVVHGEVIAPGQRLVPSDAHGRMVLGPTEVLGLSQDQFNAAAGATFADHDTRLDALEDAMAREYPEQWEAVTGDADGL